MTEHASHGRNKCLRPFARMLGLQHPTMSYTLGMGRPNQPHTVIQTEGKEYADPLMAAPSSWRLHMFVKI